MSVRPAAVAGLFYPQDADELRSFILTALNGCEAGSIKAKALIVPHAGYIYSGLTAAHAYATLKGRNIRRVLLLGPAHRVAFYGLALPDADAFATPLGQIRLDRDGMDALLEMPDININTAAHAMEHSLEVQLPFLQQVLADFSLIPLCVGAADIASVAGAVQQFLDDEQTLIIISSDLSHFHPYSEAREIDKQSIARILDMHPDLSHEQACGATPINGLLLAAESHPLTPKLLDYRNSGDTAGDKDSVVGYTSIAFSESSTEVVHE